MNPLTNVRNIAKLNEQELKLGIVDEKHSWHFEYKDSAYIFIGGLPYDLSEGDLLCVFSQYGEIVNINLVRDKKTGKSKGYCFMAYEDQRSTILAVDNLNSSKLGGRTLRVDHVSEYRRPKSDEKDESGNLKEKIEEGCAPKTPSPSPSEDDITSAKEKKKKKEKKKRKREKEHPRRRKKSPLETQDYQEKSEKVCDTSRHYDEYEGRSLQRKHDSSDYYEPERHSRQRVHDSHSMRQENDGERKERYRYSKNDHNGHRYNDQSSSRKRELDRTGYHKQEESSKHSKRDERQRHKSPSPRSHKHSHHHHR